MVPEDVEGTNWTCGMFMTELRRDRNQKEKD